MPSKRYRLQPEQIRAIAPGRGSCFATDRITIDGRRVGYMYREQPDSSRDSGWRFCAGDESWEYMECAANLGIYDVNTIANYDPDIVPFLDSPFGRAFERDPAGAFVEVEFEPGD